MAIDFFRENHYNMIDTRKNGCQHIKKTAVKERKVSMKKRMLAAILSGIMVITGISACSAYSKAEENTEDVFLYVTFRNSVTPEEMQSILAKADSKGNIRVTEVYLSDNTKVKGSEAIAALFEENAKDITAVKVYCPGNFLIKLTALDGVYLVETEDSFSKDDFSAIDTSSEYDYYPDYSTTEPVTPPDAVPGDTTNVAE